MITTLLEVVLSFLFNAVAATGTFLWRQRHKTTRISESLSPTNSQHDGEPGDTVTLGRVVAWPGESAAAVCSELPGEDGDTEDTPRVSPSANLPAGSEIRLHVSQLFSHLLATGATGSGKSTFLRNLWVWLLGRIHSAPGVFLYVDPFGDALPAVLRYLSGPNVPGGAARFKLVVLDFADAVLPTWNPLQGPGDPFTRALRVLEIIRSWHADGLGVTVEELLRNTLVCLAETGENLAALEAFLSDGGDRQAVLTRVGDPGALAYFKRFDALSPDRQDATVAATLNKVSPLLAHPRLRACFSGTTPAFDLAGILNGGESVILLVSLAASCFPGRTGFLVGSLLLAQIESLIIARTANDRADYLPLFLMVDEFGALVAGASQFSTLVTQGRRLKCAVLMAAQNLDMIPHSLLPTLLANVGTRLAFATSSGAEAASLAQSVVSHLPKEQVKAVIVGLPVGQCIATRRGEPSVLLQVQFHPEPQASPAAVAALRHAAREALVQPGNPHDTSTHDPQGQSATALTTAPTAVDAHEATPENTQGVPDTPPATYELREVPTNENQFQSKTHRKRNRPDNRP